MTMPSGLQTTINHEHNRTDSLLASSDVQEGSSRPLSILGLLYYETIRLTPIPAIFGAGQLGILIAPSSTAGSLDQAIAF